MNKQYLSADDFYLDSFRLAKKIINSGWRPDYIIALWRGGAPVGVCVHEFFRYNRIDVKHAVLKCSSYTGIDEKNDKVDFENADTLFDGISPSAKILFVDDVFDSGQTAAAVHKRFSHRIGELKFAAVYWKPTKNTTSITPDYHLKETEEWIVFPHEMMGLDDEEIAVKNPALHKLLHE